MEDYYHQVRGPNPQGVTYGNGYRKIRNKWAQVKKFGRKLFNNIFNSFVAWESRLDSS